MRGKRVVVGISGGIAAFKAATIVSQLSQRGADVRVIMTASATKFITPLTLQTLSRHHVAVDTFEERDPAVVSHIDLADHADLFVLAPATANLIGKLALGLGDDMLSTTLLATRAPIVIAPAMNVHMYENPVVQKNIMSLRERGVSFIEPGEGQLACGYVGRGRMAEPEQIVEWVEAFFSQEQPLAGKKVLVTAGPTVEPLDPVRFFSNYSSGKMGYAMAAAAREAGAEVTLVSGPVSLPTPEQVKRIDVKRTEEMREAVLHYLPQMDVIIKAAAVADYRPSQMLDRKMKKTVDAWTIELEKTPDIALEVGKRKEPHQFFVGFAAETEEIERHARSKLERKGMDLIVANNVSLPGAGFGTDTNIVTVYDREGEVLSLPEMNKIDVARRIIALIGERLHVQ
ncbi:bifunctional phosphopantothenoylcysteine decarboxylase/phosphopantothenate--cysteine ligase CoaBC [Paenactinomyces guangxiensis]|uniref:Coenzyme A biosynthesis bifunctional protein CoaBC n=1 Tax=Paenactinomyces guangxiensis TaxID=1490290 RepID=A0A7W1WQI2_9BACL|nr:bifunctional phosphopantothenoylcysteine decarboxylase/phosphopantothenate--cysteine ligase CoaBC [Paenactinomyces guangxiensis]MBA4494190.1 bifunctional phosphopantothenoylcysteine decarboxylase/phosphopantothenate--cysteine ligase CoaBC [Paenactinomyces guangxiensis]MBH8590686.1 bifunctional phosphopantothenoylcysteine decarboxylase/phosphopantothenate--cysteine ligase CoaBC [Paenactinomyces guangxiensis]